MAESLLEWVLKSGLAYRHKPGEAAKIFEHYSPDAVVPDVPRPYSINYGENIPKNFALNLKSRQGKLDL